MLYKMSREAIKTFDEREKLCQNFKQKKINASLKKNQNNSRLLINLILLMIHSAKHFKQLLPATIVWNEVGKTIGRFNFYVFPNQIR